MSQSSVVSTGLAGAVSWCEPDLGLPPCFSLSQPRGHSEPRGKWKIATSFKRRFGSGAQAPSTSYRPRPITKSHIPSPRTELTYEALGLQFSNSSVRRTVQVLTPFMFVVKYFTSVCIFSSTRHYYYIQWSRKCTYLSTTASFLSAPSDLSSRIVSGMKYSV